MGKGNSMTMKGFSSEESEEVFDDEIQSSSEEVGHRHQNKRWGFGDRHGATAVHSNNGTRLACLCVAQSIPHAVADEFSADMGHAT